MTSHEYADKLMKVVRLLQTSTEFEMPSYIDDNSLTKYGIDTIRYYSDKERFLAAVRAVGSGKKAPGSFDTDFTFVPDMAQLHISVDRDKVCRIIKPAQPAEYECEPLLSPAEEAEVGK